MTHPSKQQLQQDAADIRRRLEQERTRLDAESQRLDAEEQRLMELEEVIDAYPD